MTEDYKMAKYNRDFDVTHIGEQLIALLINQDDCVVKKRLGKLLDLEIKVAIPNATFQVVHMNKKYVVDPEANIDIMLETTNQEYYAVELKLGNNVTASSFNETKGFLRRKCDFSYKVAKGSVCSFLRNHQHGNSKILYNDDKSINKKWILLVRNQKIKDHLYNSMCFEKFFNLSEHKIPVILSLKDIFNEQKLQVKFSEGVKELIKSPDYWSQWFSEM